MMTKIFIIEEEYDVCKGYEKAYFVCTDLGFFTDRQKAEDTILEHAKKVYAEDLELIELVNESVRNIARMLTDGRLTFEEDDRGCTVRFDPTDKQLVNDIPRFGTAMKSLTTNTYDFWSNNEGVMTIINCSAEAFSDAVNQVLEDSFSVQHISLEDYIKKYLIVELAENGNGEAVE